MFKKLLFITVILAITSCSTDKNTNTFYKFVSREKYMQNIEPDRIFNPDSAMLIATLPNHIGNMKSVGEISDFEILKNGLGYSKRYKNKSIKNGYWADIFTFHTRQTKISSDINNNIVRAVYRNIKNDTLNSYFNSKLLSESILIFTTPTNKTLKMREMVFEYKENENSPKMRGYLYFGTNMDSFYKIRISNDENLDLYDDKEYFLKDFAYYYAEEMSLNDYNKFKKSKENNIIKVERIK